MKRTILSVGTVGALCLGWASAVAQSSAGAPKGGAAARLAGLRGFVGMDMRFGEMSDEFAMFVGAEMALLMNRGVYLGIRGAGLATDNAHVPAAGSTVPDTLRIGYGGFIVGHLVPVSRTLAISVDALVGAGSVGTDGTPAEDRDAVFVFEPSATLDLKLARPVRVAVGASYRFVGDASVPGVSDAKLRGFSGTLRLRLGRF